LKTEDFSSIQQLKISKSELMSFKLGRTVQAKYVKLVLLQPNWSPYQQIVEFGVGSNSSKNSAEPTSEVMGISAVPMEYALDQNYPNPFNPVTTIFYSLPDDVQVKLTVFSITGREVATLADEFQSKGSYSVQWNANGNPSGLYFYQLSAGSFNKTLRMIMLK